MEKCKANVNLVGKKINIEYEDTLLLTNNSKVFNKLYLCNDVLECGVHLAKDTISMLGTEDKSTLKKAEDIYVPTSTNKEAVAIYQTALKVIDIEEIDRLKMNRQILKKIKQDIIDSSDLYLVPFALIGLFYAKNVGQVFSLATLCLLCQINMYEAIKMIKAFMVSDYDKKVLEDKMLQVGLGDLVDEPVSKDDLKLYMKLKSNDLKFQ